MSTGILALTAHVRNRTRQTALACCAAALLAAPAPQAAEPAQHIAEADLARWNAAMARGAADDIVTPLAPDALLIGPDGEVSRDKEAFRRFWRNLVATRNGVHSLKLLTARQENLDTVVSRAELTDVESLGKPGATITYRYQGVLHHVLKRLPDGSWKVQVQRWRGQERN